MEIISKSQRGVELVKELIPSKPASDMNSDKTCLTFRCGTNEIKQYQKDRTDFINDGEVVASFSMKDYPDEYEKFLWEAGEYLILYL